MGCNGTFGYTVQTGVSGVERNLNVMEVLGNGMIRGVMGMNIEPT